jgi:hypothetical protein
MGSVLFLGFFFFEMGVSLRMLRQKLVMKVSGLLRLAKLALFVCCRLILCLFVDALT